MAKGIFITDKKIKMKALRRFIDEKTLFFSVNKSTFLKWIGKTNPTEKTLEPFCASVGLSISDLQESIEEFAKKVALIAQHDSNDVLNWINRSKKTEQKNKSFPFNLKRVYSVSNIYFVKSSVDLYNPFFMCCDAISNFGGKPINYQKYCS